MSSIKSTIKAKAEAGHPTVGIWVTIPAIPSAETVGALGLDWGIVDTQHGGVTAADLVPVLLALGRDTPAIVRVSRERLGGTVTADMLKRGINFLAVGSDRGYIQQGVQRDLRFIREQLA